MAKIIEDGTKYIIKLVENVINKRNSYKKACLPKTCNVISDFSEDLKYEELGEAGLQDRRGKRKKDQQPRTELEKAQIEIERLKHALHKAEMERDLLKKLDEVVRRDVYRK